MEIEATGIVELPLVPIYGAIWQCEHSDHYLQVCLWRKHELGGLSTQTDQTAGTVRTCLLPLNLSAHTRKIDDKIMDAQMIWMKHKVDRGERKDKE